MTLPKVLLKIAIFHCVLLSISIALAKVTINKENPGKCDLSTAGNLSIVNDRNGDQRVLVCVKNNGKYIWRELDKFPTLGEFFNPAKDCSDIVTKRRNAKSGLYWINGFGLKGLTKVWCDLTTDGGGFLLIGYKNSPQSWTVPSDSSLVSPKGSPHWSSEFGNVPMLEFRIQLSTTNNFADSKAEWLYRFTSPRPLNKLLSDNGGCTKRFPGIENIKYVKDLLVGKIVTQNFQCSRFGPPFVSGLGWEMMNNCLGKPCKKGFAVFPGTNFRYYNYGAFSYSTVSPRSGISHNSTVFIGCEHGKCCACYGPKGASGDFCTPTCQSTNGGTVTTTSHTWFWIRSSVPQKPVWNKCTEFQVQTSDGKTETHFIDEITGVSKKGSCSKKEIPNLVPGIAVVPDSAAAKKIPSVPGLLEYRKDNKKLYIRANKTWNVVAEEDKVVNILNTSLSRLETRLDNLVNTDLSRVETELRNVKKTLREVISTMSDDSSSLILFGRPDFRQLIEQWLPVKTPWHLCWRASRDGWAASTFHSRCNNKGATVTIVRVGQYIFGGYNDLSWTGSGGWKSSSNAFLFSLRNKDNLKPFKAPVYRYSGYAIYDSSGYGPSFGYGHDFHIHNNAHSSTSSYSNLCGTYQPPSGYSYGSSNTRALLAGSYHFTPSEVEVFYLG